MSEQVPFNNEAEQAVLSALLGDNTKIPIVRQQVRVDDFYRLPHRLIYSALLEVSDRGVAVDPLTLASELERAGTIEQAGGKNYIGYLIDATATSSNVAYHAQLVKDTSERRDLIDIAEQLRKTAMTQPARAAAVEATTALVPYAIEQERGGFRHISTMLREVLEEIKARGEQQLPGIGTGFPEIDDHTHGFREGELVILAGVPGSGKTALALQIALNAVISDVGAAFVSAEMQADALIERAFNTLGKIPTYATQSGRLSKETGEFQRLVTTAKTLRMGRFWIDDQASPLWDDVRARSLHLKAQHPELKLLFIDFLQLVQIKLRDRSEATELKTIAYGMKNLAKELRLVVVATAQLNDKDVEDSKDKRPSLRDIQGTSGIRQAADFVGLCFREKMYQPLATRDTLLIDFAKTRRVKPFQASLLWEGQYMRVDSPRRLNPELPLQ